MSVYRLTCAAVRLVRTRCILIGLWGAGVISLSGAEQLGEQWPAWRGPLQTGASPTADPPVRWSETENVRWKTPIPGDGTATPIVWGNQVFVLTAVPAPGGAVDTGSKSSGTGTAEPPRGPGGFRSEKPTQPVQFNVVCLERSTGKMRWTKTLKETLPHEGHHKDHGFASASPVTDGQMLIVSFGSRGLYGLDLEGNVKWNRDLGLMQTRNSFGEGSSPALHGDTVVLLWDHEGEDFIAAFDKNTGREKWRTPRDEPTTWSTPLIVEHGGRSLVVVPATGKTRCYDLADGQQVWEAPGLTANVIPSPVGVGDMVYVTSGFRGSMVRAIKLGGKGNLEGTPALVWQADRATPYVPSPLLVDGYLYLLSSNNGLLSCLDAKTGQPGYAAERLAGIQNVYASPVAARDRIYVLGRDGACLVLRRGPKLEILATNKVDDATDASIALAGRDLFIRGQHRLYCVSAP